LSIVHPKSKKSCPNDCYYDIAKQIVKRSKFLYAVDGYIKNAKVPKTQSVLRYGKQSELMNKSMLTYLRNMLI